jgi:hypothetical protein
MVGDSHHWIRLCDCAHTSSWGVDRLAAFVDQTTSPAAVPNG